jgi:hypothetical protein
MWRYSWRSLWSHREQDLDGQIVASNRAGSLSDIGNTLRLWVANRHSTFLVLAQGPTGTPEPVEPTPILHKAVYLSIYEASGDLRTSSAQLDGRYVLQLMLTELEQRACSMFRRRDTAGSCCCHALTL